jgi:hypothetical protein
MEIFARWEVWGWLLALLVPLGVGFVGMNEPRLAKSCFVISGLVLGARIVMWGAYAKPSFGNRALVFAACGLVGVVALESLRWIERRNATQQSTQPLPMTPLPSGTTSPKAPLQSPPELPPINREATPTETLVVPLMFKDSPLLTPSRKKLIASEINGAAVYLQSFGPLGIPVPDEIPPIGVDTTNPKGQGWAFNSQSNQKYYYNQFNLQPGMLDDREKITEAYMTFALGRFLYKPSPPLPSQLEKMTPEELYAATHTPEQMDPVYRWKASGVLRRYLNHSYWNQPLAENERPVCPDLGDGTAYYFWRIREKFGREFADKLAILVLRATMDKPHTDPDENYKRYFYERLKMADSVIDNENSRMSEIDDIYTECGWLPIKQQ